MIRLLKSRGGTRLLDGGPAAQKRSITKRKPGVKFPAPPAPRAAVVAVDYPQAAERVVSPAYSIRLSVQSAGAVEVSIDDEAWQTCRQAEGYWWHDWSGYRSGAHTICARLTVPRGRRSLSEKRGFFVALP